MTGHGWVVRQQAQPMTLEPLELLAGAGEVLVEVAGCGVCHTDLGFFYDGVPTRHPFPLVLGHEVAGTVVEAGEGARDWVGRQVVVPAVIPCGDCEACDAGRGAVCPQQVFPGNDLDGGFATHLVVPARGLCPVPDLADPERNRAGLDLPTLAVIADAVSTPYQAITRSGLARGDLAVFVGVGGVGGFGLQVAAALGARCVAIDVDRQRMKRLEAHGAARAFDATQLDFKALKAAVRDFARELGVPTFRQYVFECSGTPAGQATAFGLLGHGGYLGVVGYTPRKVELRLSNLMALDATAQGNWGCLPEHYPAVVELALSGAVALAPFVEFRPMSTINRSFEDLHQGRLDRRLVLVPEGWRAGELT
jgi:6-hydroxycyclohex-1-ene-1-carbonyl-CoA dehydrogenase